MLGSADNDLRRGWRPGLIGEITAAHARYYQRYWGFDHRFEVYITDTLGRFWARYDSTRDLTLSAWDGGIFLGSISIDGADPEASAGQSRLRWFIMADKARGMGLGRRLMAEALRFSDDTGYESCFLTTFGGLDAARHLYESSGFWLTATEPGTTWGHEVQEQWFLRHRPTG